MQRTQQKQTGTTKHRTIETQTDASDAEQKQTEHKGRELNNRRTTGKKRKADENNEEQKEAKNRAHEHVSKANQSPDREREKRKPQPESRKAVRRVHEVTGTERKQKQEASGSIRDGDQIKRENKTREKSTTSDCRPERECWK